MNVPEANPRVAFLRWNDDRAALSGMPWNMSAGLESAGCDTANVLLNCTPKSLRRPRFSAMPARNSVKQIARRLRRFSGRVLPDRTYRSSIRETETFAEIASSKINAGEFDLVVAVNMSGLVSRIETPLPIVYATDATASLANVAYESFADRRRGQRDAGEALETEAARRADLVLVASEYCRRSMCDDHDADPSKVHVVPLGANLIPESDEIVGEVSTPTPDGELELVVSAADPERKRVALCAAVAQAIEARGWRVRLHYIGPRHAICDLGIVEWAGRLDHGLEADRRKHRAILRRAHLSILPSTSEMYGIAPIESAAFGRPAIVSAVGGLTTVVQDGITGRCLPVETPVSGWVDAIESMVAPPGRYRAYAAAALRRYQEELNWEAWGRRVKMLVQELVRR